MIGAIIGDIVGSRFEFNNHRSKDFKLFTEDCQVTDDSIMTLAIAKAMMETEKKIKPSYDENDAYYSLLEGMTIDTMQEIGRKYPDCGYGGMFSKWVFCDEPEPYNSFGNGAAMRVSPAGFAARTEYEACRLSESVTVVTHNHEEGLKGAEATAVAIFMARRGFTKNEIREKMKNYYSLDFTIDGIRDNYQFNETCQETVPQAIVAFLESTSFEDAIRTAISVGGDSDTLAAITGAIAEAYYGVPEKIRERALTYLDHELRAIYGEWCDFDQDEGAFEKFKVLTKYIDKLTFTEKFGGEWIFRRENDENSETLIQLLFVNYDELVHLFVDEFYQFSQVHPEYKLTSYGSTIEENGLKWNIEDMRSVEVELLDEQCILALIMGVIRAERFNEGILLNFLKDGIIIKWLKRLKAIDISESTKEIEEIYFEIGGFEGFDKFHIIFNGNSACLNTTHAFEMPTEKNYSIEETDKLLNKIHSIHVEYWNSDYFNPCVCDGTSWWLAVKYKGQRDTVWQGNNAYPSNFDDFLSCF